MTERLMRLIRIIILIQSKPGIMAREIANMCETSERTIYRDLELLSLVTPITNLGHKKGYQFVGNFSLYPLDWDEQEALAFTMLPSILDQLNSSLLSPKFNSAYQKVMATYYKEKKDKAEIIKQITDIIQMGTPAYNENQENFLFSIVQAILLKKRIEVVYLTQSRNEKTTRILDPYYLVPREQRFYLIAYCHTNNDVRTFRISRFRKLETTNITYEMGNFRLQSYLKNTWSIERGDKNIHFKVKFSSNVARYIKEEELFVKPKLEDLDDGSLLFEVSINNDREFLQWILQYGVDAEIIEPIEYRGKMVEMLSRWKRIYE